MNPEIQRRNTAHSLHLQKQRHDYDWLMAVVRLESVAEKTADDGGDKAVQVKSGPVVLPNAGCFLSPALHSPSPKGYTPRLDDKHGESCATKSE